MCQVDVGISIVAKNDRPFLGVVRCDALIGDIKIVLGGGATYVDSFTLPLLPRLHEFHSARTNESHASCGHNAQVDAVVDGDPQEDHHLRAPG
jgi:hypothetical protein